MSGDIDALRAIVAAEQPPPGPGAFTAVTAQAFTIAHNAHRGQRDKQGRDYLLWHLAPIASTLRPFGEHAEAAGWLHDVLEDTAVTTADLVRAGVPDVVIDAVLAVTRRGSETYDDLIARSCAHPIGLLVKLADNWANLTGLADLARTDPDTAARLREKYTRARETLLAALATGGPA